MNILPISPNVHDPHHSTLPNQIRRKRPKRMVHSSHSIAKMLANLSLLTDLHETIVLSHWRFWWASMNLLRSPSASPHLQFLSTKLQLHQLVGTNPVWSHLIRLQGFSICRSLCQSPSFAMVIPHNTSQDYAPNLKLCSVVTQVSVHMHIYKKYMYIAGYSSKLGYERDCKIAHFEVNHSEPQLLGCVFRRGSALMLAMMGILSRYTPKEI